MDVKVSDVQSVLQACEETCIECKLFVIDQSALITLSLVPEHGTLALSVLNIDLHRCCFAKYLKQCLERNLCPGDGFLTFDI